LPTPFDGLGVVSPVEPPIGRQVAEGHYLETRDGLFFAVKGAVHPPTRFVACLRYAPDPIRGDREKDGRRYRRL
jgi:predicted nucleotidyltransferase